MNYQKIHSVNLFLLQKQMLQSSSQTHPFFRFLLFNKLLTKSIASTDKSISFGNTKAESLASFYFLIIFMISFSKGGFPTSNQYVKIQTPYIYFLVIFFIRKLFWTDVGQTAHHFFSELIAEDRGTEILNFNVFLNYQQFLHH